MTAPERVTILIVDDYPANLLALSAVLDDPAYDVIEATSGPEALEIVRTRNVTLILLDIQMPGMDGYQVAREVRKDPRTKDIPIIFVTAVYKEDPAVRQGYLAGGQDYLGKPFDPDVLKAKVAIYSSLFVRSLQVEQRRMELEKSEERYRQIVEGAQEIMATIDVNGTITTLNLAFERLTGFRCQEWVGKSFLPLMEGEDLADLLTALGGRDPDNQVARLIQASLRTADDRRIPIEISVQPLLRDGVRTGAIGVMRDISPRAAA